MNGSASSEPLPEEETPLQRQTISLDLAAFEERLHNLRNRIENHLPDGGSQPQIVAVSKYLSPADAQVLRDSGHTPLGENRAQELLARSDPGIGRDDWHFIGHLQRNKIHQVIPRIGMLHSLDSTTLARSVNRWVDENDTRPLPCLIQVNISGEGRKGGLDPSQALLEVPRWFEEFPSLVLKGLMTMPPRGPAEKCRGIFRMLRDRLQDGIGAVEALGFQQLSMGMSSDWQIAVEEGATILRIGRMLYQEVD